jgi:hypothetical protein
VPAPRPLGARPRGMRTRGEQSGAERPPAYASIPRAPSTVTSRPAGREGAEPPRRCGRRCRRRRHARAWSTAPPQASRAAANRVARPPNGLGLIGEVVERDGCRPAAARPAPRTAVGARPARGSCERLPSRVEPALQNRPRGGAADATSNDARGREAEGVDRSASSALLSPWARRNGLARSVSVARPAVEDVGGADEAVRLAAGRPVSDQRCPRLLTPQPHRPYAPRPAGEHHRPARHRSRRDGGSGVRPG